MSESEFSQRIAVRSLSNAIRRSISLFAGAFGVTRKSSVSITGAVSFSNAQPAWGSFAAWPGMSILITILPLFLLWNGRKSCAGLLR